MASLDPRGPAGAAGVLPGDLVVAMNGIPVESVDDLHRLLSGAASGDIARLDLIRGAEKTSVDVALGDAAA
ncbi:MAG: PDZ domain-containing protein [Deltaproteobacteria bacterium]